MRILRDRVGIEKIDGNGEIGYNGSRRTELPVILRKEDGSKRSGVTGKIYSQGEECMAISKKLEIIYHNGQPDGIRSIRRHLSTMTIYVIPRPLLSEARKLTGIHRPGIYYLISERDDNKIAQIYIGQTRNGVNRLDDHNRSKDFWNKAIMFLADSKTFSLDMISGLEAYTIGKAMESKRYKVENTVNPRYEIDEYDLPLIEEVYEEIKFIMATQGYKMENTSETLNEASVLHTTRNGVQALGVYDGEKFEVLERSEIDLSRPCHSKKMEAQRQTAVQNGDICCKDGKYTLNVSVCFISSERRYAKSNMPSS